MTAAALAAVVVGVLAGWLVYRGGPRAETSPVFRIGDDELGFDAAGDGVVIAASGLAGGTDLLDHYLVDGGGRGLVRVGVGLAGALRNLQNGKVRTYGLVMVFGVVIILAAVVVGQVI